MARVIYAKESRTRGYISLGVMIDGEKRNYTVPPAIYSSLGSPTPRTELDADTLGTLAEADAEHRALKKALSLLSYADNSYRALVMKLKRAGFSSAAAENAASEAVRLGYIDEERQLRRLIIQASGDLTGPQRLIPRLVAKGYPQGKIREAIDELIDLGELDFEANKQALLEKKLPADATDEERTKLLFKYGYKTY